MPGKPEELPLSDLASGLASFSGTLGKHTSSLVARIFSSKMLGGFTQSVARKILQATNGLGPHRQDALLLIALTMEPASRLGSEADAKAWLDSVAQVYAKRAGVTYSPASASASGASGNAAAVVINSAEFERAQREQREHALQQLEVLARFAGVDTRENARSYENASAEKQVLQNRLDLIEAEFGRDLVEGTGALFDSRKARRYDSCWNWARQDAVEWIYAALLGKACLLDAARLHHLANCSTPSLLKLVAAAISAMEKSDCELSQQAAALAKRIHATCKETLDSPPVYKELSAPTRPVTNVTLQGDIEYSEVLRENEPSFADYVQHMKLPVFGSKPPFLHLRGPLDEGRWSYNSQLSEVYFGALEQMSTAGVSFARKTALVTGCGRGSIGAGILRGLLSGGARVVATTSSHSRTTTLFYEEMYRVHGARGSELIVVPFNQGSTADIKALVDYIYSSSGLGWDLDFVIPFAAISEVGYDFTQLNSRSELAHRIMLTNVLRLLGEIKDTKANCGYGTRPSVVILPLSPNHGTMGGDGLYGESKIGLETAFGRWKSESWADYLSVVGAVIGLTHSTGLTRGSGFLAPECEMLGVRTYSPKEMAFNVLGLLHPDVVGLAESSPVYADLNGGFQYLEDPAKTIASTRSALNTTSSQMKEASMRAALDYKTGTIYTGWIDAKSGEPVKDGDVKEKYEAYILEHTGARLIEPEMMDGYNPNKKQFLRELQIEHDMEPFEASADEAAAFKHQNGNMVDVWENRNGSWSVRFLKGAVIHVPKALRYDRLVAAQLPTGWDPARYGIPQDVIKQVDAITCYALVATAEALVRSGITDPYELYKYFHVSEVGTTIGSTLGGSNHQKLLYKDRFLDRGVQNDALQEALINIVSAWVNMLLLSLSGPVKPTVGACGTGILAVDVAVETIQSGKAKVMIAGACDSITEEFSYEFVDDIGVASFHGTSTIANDKNESEVLHEQLEHLGRTPGLAVPAVCQKWLTGHPKGPAAAWKLNGVLQSLRTGIVPGNRNADNIDPEFERLEHIIYPSRSIQTPGIKAGLLKSFGFGQVGGEILVVHPDYVLAVLTCEELQEYNKKLKHREAKSYRYWQDTLVGSHSLVQIKSAPPYSLEKERQVYLDPLARAKHDSATDQYKF
ncbi:hypothetical protein GQ54DRAFT_323123 [Martensiomyces pterosporus]|nr:hypothetical protein GQ54DRAFT_323123 [Martensiomyces pterosporus]